MPNRLLRAVRREEEPQLVRLSLLNLLLVRLLVRPLVSLLRSLRSDKVKMKKYIQKLYLIFCH